MTLGERVSRGVSFRNPQRLALFRAIVCAALVVASSSMLME